MARIIQIDQHLSLDEYSEVAHLREAVRDLRTAADRIVPRLEGRTLWMVNSAPQGGGVAEMLPPIIFLLRELGVCVRWAVMESEDPAFFALTKRIHNLIHGAEESPLDAADRALYDRVSRENATSIRSHLGPSDILFIHDPQPLGMGALLSREMGLRAIWRCHIGLDARTARTEEAWSFLEPYALAYDHSVFSAPEYIPDYLAGSASIVHPGVDPLSHKNRDLSLHKLVGVLVDAALVTASGPVLTPPFPEPARRLQPDGTLAPATKPEDMGLLFRPIVTQISRWDKLKGFRPLMQGFAELKRGAGKAAGTRNVRHGRMLEIVRLVLAGPDPASVQDDPEATQVFEELRADFAALKPEIQRDILIITLPMGSRKHNALMVNALQRSSTIVAQNSLREGFGLTATEAMWKRIAVMGSHACGLRQQIRDGVDGRLVAHPDDPSAVARVLDEMLADPVGRERWGRNAQRRVHDDFLIFSQLRRTLEVIVGDVTD